MNNSLERLIEGIIATLRADVIPQCRPIPMRAARRSA